MTKQITVKLNHKLFSPIINGITSFENKGSSKTNSECVGKMIFLVHQMLYKKYDEKTKIQIISEGLGMSLNEQLVEFNREYSEFLKNGNHW
jgi:hypothetical protein